MKYKKLLLIFVLCIVALFTFSCKSEGESKAEKKEITVLAAASLTDVCNEIKDVYEKKEKVKINFSYGSSGALQSQIEEGVNADCYMSAAMAQMNTLVDKGLVKRNSVVKLLENKVVLIVPKSSNKDIKSFKDLDTDKVKIVGIGEPNSVPAGKYAKQVLTSLNIWDKVRKKGNFGTDVRTVLSWVEMREVDCGVVYETDAKISHKVKIVDTATDKMCDKVIYPAGILSKTNKDKDARAFMKFLQSDDAIKIFKKYGFYEVK